MLKNKKIIICIIIVVLVGIIVGVLNIMDKQSQKRISDDIIKYMQDSINSNNNNITKEYIDKNISKVTKEAATEMVTLYEQYQDKNIDRLYTKFKEILLKYNGQYTVETLNNIENITDEKLKNVLTEIRNNGYKFKAIWGNIIIVKDYSQFVEYEEYISDEKKTYIEIQNNYEKNLYSYNDINTLLNSIVEAEKNIKKMKNIEIKNDTARVYGNMLLLILEGDEIYVPKVYGEEDNQAIINSMQTCINDNPNTVIAEMLTKYIEAIQIDEYEYGEETNKLTEDIKNNINTYFN